jgi:hypothetical protein
MTRADEMRRHGEILIGLIFKYAITNRIEPDELNIITAAIATSMMLASKAPVEVNVGTA